jgi:ATP-binding cassette, subfamily C, bacteriocin exporter
MRSSSFSRLPRCFFYSWQFSLALIPAIFVLMVFNNLINRKFQRELMERTADLESHLVESLSNQLSLRALQLQNWATLKTETRFVDLLRAAWQATIARSSSRAQPTSSLKRT